MAAITIGQNARRTWLTGLVAMRAKVARKIQRALACAAATVLIVAAVVVLAELAVQILSICAPAGAAALAVMAAALLRSLCRARTARRGAGTGPATRGASGRKSRRISW